MSHYAFIVCKKAYPLSVSAAMGRSGCPRYNPSNGTFLGWEEKKIWENGQQVEPAQSLIVS